MKNRLHTLIATGFGSGKSSVAPGTCGSIAALLPWVAALTIAPHFFSPLLQLITTILICILGTVACETYLKGSKDKDPSEVVIDEWAGLYVAFILASASTLSECIIILILFRIFDISKIWPISLFEKLKGSIGVMSDDIVAGIFAGALFLVFKTFFYI